MKSFIYIFLQHSEVRGRSFKTVLLCWFFFWHLAISFFFPLEIREKKLTRRSSLKRRYWIKYKAWNKKKIPSHLQQCCSFWVQKKINSNKRMTRHDVSMKKTKKEMRRHLLGVIFQYVQEATVGVFVVFVSVQKFILAYSFLLCTKCHLKYNEQWSKREIKKNYIILRLRQINSTTAIENNN